MESAMLLSYFAKEAGTLRDLIAQLEREVPEIKEPASEVMFLAMLAYGLVKACLPVLKGHGFIRKVESQAGSWQTNRHGAVQIDVLKRKQHGASCLHRTRWKGLGGGQAGLLQRDRTKEQSLTYLSEVTLLESLNKGFQNCAPQPILEISRIQHHPTTCYHVCSQRGASL